jgi:hypothetical protein
MGLIYLFIDVFQRKNPPKVLALQEREFSVGGFSVKCYFRFFPPTKMDAGTAYKFHSISLRVFRDFR